MAWMFTAFGPDLFVARGQEHRIGREGGMP